MLPYAQSVYLVAVQLYLHHGGQQSGPYSLEQVSQWLAEGALPPGVHAWHEGAPEWVPLEEVPGIHRQTAPQPASGNSRKLLITIAASATVLALAIGAVVAFQKPSQPSSGESQPPDTNPPSAKAALPSPAMPAQHLTYKQDIEPIFKKHRCYECHDSTAGKVRGDLDLIVPFNVAAVVDTNKVNLSRLILRLTDEKEPMPPNGPMLSSPEINTVRQWIQDGAKYK